MDGGISACTITATAYLHNIILCEHTEDKKISPYFNDVRCKQSEQWREFIKWLVKMSITIVLLILYLVRVPTEYNIIIIGIMKYILEYLMKSKSCSK